MCDARSSCNKCRASSTVVQADGVGGGASMQSRTQVVLVSAPDASARSRQRGVTVPTTRPASPTKTPVMPEVSILAAWRMQSVGLTTGGGVSRRTRPPRVGASTEQKAGPSTMSSSLPSHPERSSALRMAELAACARSSMSITSNRQRVTSRTAVGFSQGPFDPKLPPALSSDVTTGR
eukprot:scaffold1112_cov116-Isochrysis_galbana.AAC.33